MSAHGLAISAGTLANSLKRFVPLFEPLFEAILAHQNKAILRHADETGWRVQELRGEDRSSRAWLWTSVSSAAVCFHIDASRSQKTTIKSLSRKNARLRKDGKALRNRIEALEADIARLRSTGATLSKRLYGRKSEQKKKPRSERKRGQQRGAPGHGRTQRPGLEERPEEHNPPPDACVCGRCGQPYAPNGAEESTLVEIEVKAYKRVIRRPRLRRDCECALDNNLAERFLRGPAIGRRLSHGSDSVDGAKFTAIMYSVVGRRPLVPLDNNLAERFLRGPAIGRRSR